jgi:signal peptidase II
VRRRRALILTFGSGIVVWVLDQLTKAWAAQNLPFHALRPVVDHWIEFDLTSNQGAAFGILSGQGALLDILVALLLVGLLGFVLRGQVSDRLTLAALGAVLGGGLSNLADRIRTHQVIDFFRVRPWPTVFNFADVAIRAGAIVLVIAVLAGAARRRTDF